MPGTVSGYGDQQSKIGRNNEIIVGEVAYSTRLHENFRNGKESSREAGIVYAPLEQRRHLEQCGQLKKNHKTNSVYYELMIYYISIKCWFMHIER